MKKSAILDLKIEGFLPGGKGQACYDDWEITVPYALPGQIVRAKIIKKKRKQAEGRIVEVLTPRPDEITPPCAHFGQPPTPEGRGCGGCQWQQVDYQTQLEFKRGMLLQVLEPLKRLGLTFPDIPPVFPSPQDFGYRNKVEFSFGDKTYLSDDDYQRFRERKIPLPKGFHLGFHVPGSFGSVVDIQTCHLISPAAQTLYTCIKDLAPKLGGGVYDPRHHTGYWRNCVIREGVRTGELMVHLITTDTHQPDWQMLLDALDQLDLGESWIRSVLHSEHTGQAQTVGFQAPTVIFGEDLIEEALCGLRFQISPYAFFQTNTPAAEKLYQTVVDLAELDKTAVAYDLYSGTGTIAMVLAKAGVNQVYGIEDVVSAVEDAQLNAQNNDLENCHFLAGKVENLLPELIQQQAADLVIVDPPRAGLHPKVPTLLNQLQLKQLLYISCNPLALARDLQALCLEGPYQIAAIQAVDLFPQTGHLETVVKLVRPPHI